MGWSNFFIRVICVLFLWWFELVGMAVCVVLGSVFDLGVFLIEGLIGVLITKFFVLQVDSYLGWVLA